jgi:hypothetical protein
MLDIQPIQERKINKLKSWRNRYSNYEYPYKVVLNMFYDLFATKQIWSDIDQAFSGLKKYSDFQDAFSEIGEIRRDIQINYVNPRIIELLNNNQEVAGIMYSDFSDNISKARNGDNKAVVELEYCYWFYSKYNDIIMYWAALGLMGLDKHSAYREITGGDIGGLRLDSLKNAIEYFNSLFGANFSGFVDADGNDVNPLLNPSVKSYPKDFIILPKLW